MGPEPTAMPNCPREHGDGEAPSDCICVASVPDLIARIVWLEQRPSTTARHEIIEAWYSQHRPALLTVSDALIERYLDETHALERYVEPGPNGPAVLMLRTGPAPHDIISFMVEP